MKDLWNKQYKNLILVFGYITVACIVYGVLAQSIWHLWYVTLIVVFAVLGIGLFIGIHYIKEEISKSAIQEADNTQEQPTEENSEVNSEDEKNDIENNQ